MVAVGSYFVASTYAKYTTDVAGSSAGTVAKWKWVINNSTIDSTSAATNGYTFNLFDTVKDSDLTSNETLIQVKLHLEQVVQLILVL